MPDVNRLYKELPNPPPPYVTLQLACFSMLISDQSLCDNGILKMNNSTKKFTVIRHQDGTCGIQWHGHRDPKSELEAWIRLTEAISFDNEQTTAPNADGTWPLHHRVR